MLKLFLPLFLVSCWLAAVHCQTTAAPPPACDPNCAGTCLLRGAGTCDDNCTAGYGLNMTSHLCEKCSIRCPKNTSCNTCGPGKCDVCLKPSYGSYIMQNCTCVFAQCAKNCASDGCSINGGFKCDPGKCLPGFALDSSNVCVACSSRCVANCSAPGTCDWGGCGPGFGSLNVTSASRPNTFICSPCDVNCNGSCRVAGAWKCDDTCKAGYSLNTTTHQCYRCGLKCKGTCSEGPGLCDEGGCAKGFTLAKALGDPTKKACYPCATHCETGCSASGKGCCDAAPSGMPSNATCSLGTYGPRPNSTCNACL